MRIFGFDFALIFNDDYDASFQPTSPDKKIQLITRDTQTGLRNRPGATMTLANAEGAASSNFLKEQGRLNRASPIENEGTEEEGVVRGAGAADEIEDYLTGFSDVIHHYVKKGDRMQEFNYPINILNIETIEKILVDVYNQLPRNKETVIALEVGYVLRHSVTEELRYFFGSWNTALGGARVTLNPANSESLKKAVEYYSSLDLNSYLNNNGIDSPWQLVRPVNIRCIIQFFRPEAKKKQIS